MRLVNREYDLSFELLENITNVFVIENTSVFSECVSDFWRQVNGLDGNWILSESNKQLNFSKNVLCVFNPWSLDINEKKVITKLYKEINEIANEQYIDRLAETNSEIVNFLELLIQDLPYNVSVGYDINLTGLLKLYDVKFEYDDITLLEKIITYLKLAHQILNIKCMIFIGLKAYLNENEILELYKASYYEKVRLFLIEDHFDKKISSEIVKIIDKDKCIIDL